MKFSITVLPSLLFSLNANAALCGSACDLYTLKWQDEFSSSGVDTSKWNYRTDRKAKSAQMPANVVQSGDGHLVINLKKEKVANYNYTGGGVISKQNFHYGYYESQLQMNSGAGYHTSFWLMAGDGSTTQTVGNHDRSEIDIFERDSDTNDVIGSNMNTWKADNSRKDTYPAVRPTEFYFPAWHIFGALWNETGVYYYIDGKQVMKWPFAPSIWTHDYMNIWLTSIAYGDVQDDSKLPSSIRSTYIRYYQKDYYLTAGNLCFSLSQGSTPCPANQGYKETGSSWHDSDAVKGYTHELDTRYSCNVAGAKASWSLPSASVSGTFEVWAWVLARSDSDSAASYDITKDGKSVSKLTVNQKTGTARWVRLASNQVIQSGQKWGVTMTASGAGCARADTVKFVRTA